MEELRFDAPLAVIPKLARIGDVVLAELPEGFSGAGHDTRRHDPAGCVEGVVSHRCSLHAGVTGRVRPLVCLRATIRTAE